MLASVQPTGATSGTDVMFVRSTDGGRSFSAPHRINDDPINHSKWHWFGTFSVAPNGRLDAVVAGHAKRREQHRFAAILLQQHGRRQHVVAEHRLKQFV